MSKPRFIDFSIPYNTFNNTTYNYDLLKEESAELIVAVSKVTRFGAMNFHPKDPNKETNREKLIKELGDTLAIIDIILDTPELQITKDEIIKAKHNKFTQLYDFYNFE